MRTWWNSRVEAKRHNAEAAKAAEERRGKLQGSMPSVKSKQVFFSAFLGDLGVLGVVQL
jgi:hypothetical protein